MAATTQTLSLAEALQLAIRQHQAGHLSQAEAIYRQVLEVAPNHSEVLHLLGVIAAQRNNFAQSIELINQAIAIDNTVANFYSSLGIAWSGQQQWEKAIASFNQAITLNPNHQEVHHNLGNLFRHHNRWSESAHHYRQYLALNPNDAIVHHNLGLVLMQQGQLNEAVQCYQRALTLNPNNAETYHNLGYALSELGNLAKAIDCYYRALALAPKEAKTHKNLGEILRYQGQLEKAITAYRQALALNPNEAGIYNNLGTVLSQVGKLSEAITCFQQALQLDADFLEARSNLASALLYQGQTQLAITYYKQALAKQPNALTHSNLLFALHYTVAYDLATLFSEHQQFNKHYAVSVIPSLLKERQLASKLKIGYVSTDFHKHSVAYFFEPILAHHDHEQFEIFCYYNGTTTDKVTQRLQNYADHWINCNSWSDEVFVTEIRQAQIDILVDLNGHTNHNRLLVFTRKPAPIQVTYLGYPSTTGLTAIDYRITDNYVDPENRSDSFHSEQPLRMPTSYFCYRPDEDSPPVNSLPVTEKGYITFGSFNNYAKLSTDILAIWAQVLNTIPNAKLLVKSRSLNDPNTRQRFKQELAQFDIDSGRLILANYATSTAAHLSHYHQIDIGLDSYPYNGATTTCEALWMGVPVVTLVGEKPAARMGLSILSALGLTELIAHTSTEYVDICVKLAHDTAYLQQLRANLRTQMQNSPLMDAVTFTNHLEAAYQQMWQVNVVSSES